MVPPFSFWVTYLTLASHIDTNIAVETSGGTAVPSKRDLEKARREAEKQQGKKPPLSRYARKQRMLDGRTPQVPQKKAVASSAPPVHTEPTGQTRVEVRLVFPKEGYSFLHTVEHGKLFLPNAVLMRDCINEEDVRPGSRIVCEIGADAGRSAPPIKRMISIENP